MDAGYGIYAHGTRRWALLRFDAAGGAMGEPRGMASGAAGAPCCPMAGFELRLPYVDDTELLMDLLRQGEQVRVLQPPELVAAMRASGWPQRRLLYADSGGMTQRNRMKRRTRSPPDCSWSCTATDLNCLRDAVIDWLGAAAARSPWRPK